MKETRLGKGTTESLVERFQGEVPVVHRGHCPGDNEGRRIRAESRGMLSGSMARIGKGRRRGEKARRSPAKKAMVPGQGELFPAEPATALAVLARESAGTLSLPLEALHIGSCLAPEFSGHIYAATRVSLEIHHREPPKVFLVEEQTGPSHQAVAHWETPTDSQRASYRFEAERIEKAAECLGLATLRARDGLLVRSRCERLSGADWILTDASFDLDKGIRVELSGIDLPRSPAQTRLRLLEKTMQLREGARRIDGALPGIAVVVGIGSAEVLIENVPLESDPEIT